MSGDMPPPNANVEVHVAYPAPPDNKGLKTGLKICLAIAWIFYLLPVPFVWVLGNPFNLAALVLSIICLAKNSTTAGIVGLLCCVIVSPIMYLIGWGLMILVMGGATATLDVTAAPLL